MNRNGHDNARRLQDGRWYWVSKIVVQKMAGGIGFLALAVYHFLASMTDKNQRCFPSQSYIARSLGCSRSSVGRAVNVLKSRNLIAVEKGDSSNSYLLLSVESSTDEARDGMNPASVESPKPFRGARRCDTNNTRITRNDTSVRNLLSQGKTLSKGLRPTTREEVLALDLATALNEPDKPEFYLSLAGTFPEHFLREMLSRVEQTPRHKIRKNPAAYFTFLVNQHGKRYLDHFSG